MSKRLLLGVFLVVLTTWGTAGAVAAPQPTVDSPVDASHAPHAQTVTDTVDQRQQVACNYTELYNETISSVVSIRVRTESGQGAQGTGFVYDQQGHIVTNQHVVANASTVEVRFNRGEYRTAEVVGTDVYSDLAVLNVSDVPQYVEPLPLATSPPMQGQPVAALGNPFGFQGSITHGIVSEVNRSMPTQQGFTIPNTIQTDAPINPGNSGGPLVDCNGTVIGVNRATVGQNVGFAIPASTVRDVVPSLIENGSYEHPFLGISSVDVTPIVAQANDLNETRGVLVVDVLQGSPASEALQGSTSTAQVNGTAVPTGGDVIVAIEGQQIQSQEDLASYLEEETRPGEEITLTVIRDGERQQVTVTVGERPDPQQTGGQ